MGQITTVFRISAYNHLGRPRADILSEEIDFLLTILPKGTKFLESAQMDIVDLSVRYLLTFEHPYFENGTSFNTSAVRACWPNENTLVHANFFLAINYFRPDGTEHFPE